MTPSPASSEPTSPPKVAGAGLLGLVGKPFAPPEKDAPAAASARDLEQPTYETPEPEPIEWDEDRAATVLRGLGWVIHSLDPIADTQFAPNLWKMTAEELDAIAAPASRIANRYATVRAVAGRSDELSIGLAAAPYVKRNLAARGRAKAHIRDQAQDGPHRDLYRREEAERERVAVEAEAVDVEALRAYYNAHPEPEPHIEDTTARGDGAGDGAPDGMGKPDPGDVFDLGR